VTRPTDGDRGRPGAAAPAPAPGEIVLEDATRSFSVRADQARTLKEVLLGRRGAEPPPVPALRGVTLRIAPGETVGLVGRNGAGKTSTLRVLAGIVPLQSGRADCGGRTVALLELGAGFSRDFSGRENIYLGGALYGLSRQELEQRIDRIIAFSELGEFIEVPVKTYSAGMYVRLGFSIAAHLDADTLLIDEVLAVGDEAFQRKCLRRISEQIAAGCTLVLVSHDAGSIERVCERVVVMDGGRVAFDGPTAEGLLFYHRLMGTEHGSGESVRPAPDRAIEVSEVELRDAAGRASRVFHAGDPVRIVVSLRALKPVTKPRLELEVRAQDGARAFRTVTPVELQADGSAQLAFDIGRLGLLGGDYDLALAGHDGDDDAGFDRTVRFAVAHEHGAEGIADLRGTWETLAPVSEQAGP
jgi:ABC-type polysaccharide/polyol phosphate transport system ATPase subunit